MIRQSWAFVFLCLWSLNAHALDNPKKPNIIFILADDLGYMDLGCYGNPYNETPHLNKLAIGGVRFTQAYAASTVCSPSRAAIMTGLHPARLKLTNFLIGNRTEADSPLLPAQLLSHETQTQTSGISCSAYPQLGPPHCGSLLIDSRILFAPAVSAAHAQATSAQSAVADRCCGCR